MVNESGWLRAMAGMTVGLLLGLITLVAVLVAPASAEQPRIGPQFEQYGLRPQQSEIDEVLSRSFGCPDKLLQKRRQEIGRGPMRCLLADELQAIFARQLAGGADLRDFVSRHHGRCEMTANKEASCIIEREVFSRSYMAVPFGDPTNVFERRTVFTINIRLAPDAPSGLKVDLDREDFLGSQRRS